MPSRTAPIHPYGADCEAVRGGRLRPHQLSILRYAERYRFGLGCRFLPQRQAPVAHHWFGPQTAYCETAPYRQSIGNCRENSPRHCLGDQSTGLQRSHSRAPSRGTPENLTTLDKPQSRARHKSDRSRPCIGRASTSRYCATASGFSHECDEARQPARPSCTRNFGTSRFADRHRTPGAQFRRRTGIAKGRGHSPHCPTGPAHTNHRTGGFSCQSDGGFCSCRTV